MTTPFTELGVPAELVSALARSGLTTAFDIQEATIPDALAGRDICGRAPTGSGKTLAFSIPILARVERGHPRRPRALVLAPTRELAEQIMQVMKPLAAAVNRRVAVVYGGVGYQPQRSSLRKGIDVLVACPGRLADLLQQGELRLDDIGMVVIDEADRMADMGFLPEVRRLLDRCQPDRQTMLFSATLDGDVAVLTRDYQRNPARHEVGEVEPDLTAMRHLVWNVGREHRIDRAAALVAEAGQTIVFCRTRHGADRLAKQLGQRGVDAAPIHGARSQGQRSRALADFSSGHTSALVATDVAARGIHVDDVACVLHFDLPADAKTYLHRSGRTARAGATGLVVSFVMDDQIRDAHTLMRDVGLEGPITKPDGEAHSEPLPNGESTALATGRRRGTGTSATRNGNRSAAGGRNGRRPTSKAKGGNPGGGNGNRSSSYGNRDGNRKRQSSSGRAS